MLLPGLCSVTFRALTPAQVAAAAAASGLQGIEWGSDVHAPPDQPATLREVRRVTADAGLAVTSYGTYYRLDDEPHPWERYLDAAAALGAPLLRIWAGRQGSAEVDDAQWARLVADSHRAATLAAARGLAVAYEFHGHTLTDSAAAARRLLAAVDHPALGVYWQSTIGLGEAGDLAALAAVRPWLRLVHCFWFQGQPREQLPLAAGRAAWRRYLAACAEPTVPRWVLLEFVRQGELAALTADAATLRELLAEANAAAPTATQGRG
jgi:hypothetical protein